MKIMKKKIYALLAMVMVAMTASAYSLNVGTSEHGTIAFTVNGQAAQYADEGAVVTVTVTPATGYVINQVSGEWYAAVAATRGIGTLKDVTLTKVEGKDNQWTFTMERANVEISATYKKLIQASWITLSPATLTYDGTAKQPTVTVKDGETKLAATAYNVSYSNNTNAGAEAKVTVAIASSNDSYAGTAEKTFTISPAALTEAALKDSVLTYAYADLTVTVIGVKAGELTVPADGYEVSGNVGKEVGNYTATVTGKGNYTGTLTLKYRIKEAEPTIDVEAEETTDDTEQEGKKVEDVTMVMTVADDAADKVKTETREVVNEETGEKEEVEVTVIPIVLESINIPEGTTSEEITVTVPSEIVDGNVVYQVTEIKADAFKQKEGDNTVVTKVVLPETEEKLTIEENALKPDGKLLDVVAPLSLLDDYSLDANLKENFEAKKISAIVTAPNKYWTFSSGVDCLLPEGVTAYIAEWDAEANTPRIVALEEDQLKLKDGQRGIKANNGVLIASVKGNAYEIVANPGSQESGSKPATTDAKSYAGNCLVPTIETTNYAAGDILILKDNEFHTIKSNASKVKPCKAVFSLVKAGAK